MKKNEMNNAEVIAMAEELQNALTQYTNVSLRKLALASGLNYQSLLKASKKPTAGVAYNPDEVNYFEVAKVFIRGDKSLDDIDFEELNKATNSGRVSTLSKNMDDFKVGDNVYLRTNATIPYKIIYKTNTHIVIQLIGSEEPLAWSNSTFLFKGPQFEPRTVKNESESENAEEVEA